MSRTVSVVFTVSDNVTDQQVQEGLERILKDGWSINDSVDGHHDLKSEDIQDIKVQ